MTMAMTERYESVEDNDEQKVSVAMLKCVTERGEASSLLLHD